MTLRYIVEALGGQFTERMESANKRIQKASLAAIKMAADEAKKRARASIASGGFSERFQKALQYRVYPNNGKNPAAVVTLKIKYGSVFETGMLVGGKPMLWLPLKSVPLGTGNRQLTPEQYVGRIGRLISVNNPGKPPMLFGQDFSIKRFAKRVSYKSRKVSKDAGQLVPMYIGVSSVRDPKKYDVIAAIQEAGRKVPEFYLQAFGMTDNG